MKLALKAAIFSAVVFPGSGYFLVDKKIRAWLSLGVTISGFILIMIDVYYRANIIAEKIVYGLIPMDYMAIREQILITPGQMSQDLISGLSIMIGGIWIISIVDCYLLAKRLEKTDR